MKLNEQITFEEINPEYQAFVEKFKPKKTSDDCYTPEPVYNIILDYCAERYGIDREKVVRPFWPGNDYTKIEYPDGCCVVDNPPFSILSKIVDDFVRGGYGFSYFVLRLQA